MTSSVVQSMRQAVATLCKGPGFEQVVDKLRVVGGGVGHCICEMKVEEKHQNRGGTMHGGVTAMLVDYASTMALMASERATFGVSVDLSVSYMKAAKVGEEIVIDAKTLRAGRTLAFLTVDITRKSDGALLAQGKHTKFVGDLKSFVSASEQFTGNIKSGRGSPP